MLVVSVRVGVGNSIGIGISINIGLSISIGIGVDISIGIGAGIGVGSGICTSNDTGISVGVSDHWNIPFLGTHFSFLEIMTHFSFLGTPFIFLSRQTKRTQYKSTGC